MSQDPVEAIAQAVLYEGYLLYPYRPSAVKNQFRWTIGGVHPRESGEPWQIQTQCLVAGAAGEVEVEVELRYLQPLSRTEASGPHQDAMARRVSCTGDRMALAQEGPIEGSVEQEAVAVGEGLSRITVRVSNTTPIAPGSDRESWLLHTMASAHLVLRVRDGHFVSLIDPPEKLAAEARACVQVGVWPVMVGSEEARDTMLAAPMILEDFPRIAPESPGDLFDGTEIDEILTLRILTLTDAEKDEIRRTDDRARALLERTEALTEEELMSLHGQVRR